MWLLACTERPDNADTPADPTVTPAEQVSPGPGMPPELVDQPSHNNLDVVRTDRTYLAIRTAPDHFASADTVLYVVSSEDEETWDYETEIHMGTDLREPRFFAAGETLILYFAVLGDDPLAFEPQGTMVTVRSAEGTWSTPAWWREDSFIPWRARTVDGVPTLIGYTGGADIYDADGLPALEVSLLTSTDGLAWTGLYGEGVVLTGGSSETDWVYTADGGVLAVARNEAGEESGFGSKICTAPSEDPGAWDCVDDPKKYDSPLMFTEGGRYWLVGRRNVTEDGAYDLGYDHLDFEAQALAYAAAYWVEPKRCALWEVDPSSREVRWVLDLDSRGDTCFPSALDRGDGRWTVYNYSSPVDGPDLSWIDGQFGETYIYRQDIRFPVP